MTEQIKNILNRLAELRAAVDKAEGKTMSDNQFVSRFLPVSSTVWSRVNAGNYAGNMDTIAAKLATAIEEMESRMEAIARRAERTSTFANTMIAKAVLGAWKKAKDDPFCRKVVVILAPTGGGKTAIGRYIENKHGGIYVEGSQSWQNSYKAFCADVAAAAGLPLHIKKFDERTAEHQMLTALGDKHGTLYIDEANTLGASTANAIKLLCNKTNYTVIIGATPESWDKFQAAANSEVRQVQNRCLAILRGISIEPSDVELFLGKGFADNRKEACKIIAAAANAFGAIKTVVIVCAALEQISGADLADVQKAIDQSKLNLAGGK